MVLDVIVSSFSISSSKEVFTRQRFKKKKLVSAVLAVILTSLLADPRDTAMEAVL